MSRDDYDPDDLYGSVTREEIESMISDIEINAKAGAGNGGISLSAWEGDFMDSIRSQFEDRRGPRPLSGKQLVCLSKIHDRAEGK